MSERKADNEITDAEGGRIQGQQAVIQVRNDTKKFTVHEDHANSFYNAVGPAQHSPLLFHPPMNATIPAQDTAKEASAQPILASDSFKNKNKNKAKKQEVESDNFIDVDGNAKQGTEESANESNKAATP